MEIEILLFVIPYGIAVGVIALADWWTSRELKLKEKKNEKIS